MTSPQVKSKHKTDKNEKESKAEKEKVAEKKDTKKDESEAKDLPNRKFERGKETPIEIVTGETTVEKNSHKESICKDDDKKETVEKKDDLLDHSEDNLDSSLHKEEEKKDKGEESDHDNYSNVEKIERNKLPLPDDKSDDKSDEKEEKSNPNDSNVSDVVVDKKAVKEQQGVKRRVEDEEVGGGGSRKVVRQSSSISRLENLELLASLSSSQPGLLKREREEECQEDDDEHECSGEPDSKKSNIVEILDNNDSQEDITAVITVTKLCDDKKAMEASFSSSRSSLKLPEEVQESEPVNNEDSDPLPDSTTLSPLPFLDTSPEKQSPSKVTRRVSEETKQTIGREELLNERKLQKKRLNKLLTIFEDQDRVKTINIAEDINKVKEIPHRLQSFDENM